MLKKLFILTTLQCVGLFAAEPVLQPALAKPAAHLAVSENPRLVLYPGNSQQLSIENSMRCDPKDPFRTLSHPFIIGGRLELDLRPTPIDSNNLSYRKAIESQLQRERFFILAICQVFTKDNTSVWMGYHLPVLQQHLYGKEKLYPEKLDSSTTAMHYGPRTTPEGHTINGAILYFSCMALTQRCFNFEGLERDLFSRDSKTTRMRAFFDAHYAFNAERAAETAGRFATHLAANPHRHTYVDQYIKLAKKLPSCPKAQLLGIAAEGFKADEKRETAQATALLESIHDNPLLQSYPLVYHATLLRLGLLYGLSNNIEKLRYYYGKAIDELQQRLAYISQPTTKESAVECATLTHQLFQKLTWDIYMDKPSEDPTELDQAPQDDAADNPKRPRLEEKKQKIKTEPE